MNDARADRCTQLKYVAAPMNVKAATAFADELVSAKSVVMGRAEAGVPARRTWWAFGDSQAPFATFSAILDNYGLLNSEGGELGGSAHLSVVPARLRSGLTYSPNVVADRLVSRGRE